MNLPWTKATGEAIGVPWLLAAIAPSGVLGRAAGERGRCFRRGDEAAARAALDRAGQVAERIAPERLAAFRATIGTAPDVAAALERARTGAVLSDVDFFEIGRLLDALAEAAPLASDDAFARALPDAGLALRATFEPGRNASRTFYLADAFDPKLADARAESDARQFAYDAARRREIERIARYVDVESVRDGEFALMRDRVAGPLPPEVRVLREAPAYLLCEVALDDAALAALVARDAAAARVAECEEAVRWRLSQAVANAAAALQAACDALGDLDLLAARAQFAQRYACVVPEIVDAAAIVFSEARYLPLEEELERRERPYAAISLDLDGVGVVTGPNMGGKTAALRTIGFATACVALGVPVPARSARLPLVDRVAWLGIETPQPERSLLSSFGREVVDLRELLAFGDARVLVLIDEFARTTSPPQGRALTVGVVRSFAERGAVGMVATHFSDVARAARAPHFTSGRLSALPVADAERSLDDALDLIAAAMDYRVVRVALDDEADGDALALAEALGLDASVIRHARAAL